MHIIGGAIHIQKDVAGKANPIAYASRSLIQVERWYIQTEKEALAVVWAMERFLQTLLKHVKISNVYKWD